MKVYIGADHGGFELKGDVTEYLNKKQNLSIYDCGAFEFDQEDDYVDFGIDLCKKVQGDPKTLGILICRSGIGMSIVANKFRGIYASLCFNENHAKKAREHNNANVLCLDSDYSGQDQIFKIVDTFISTSFSNEARHTRRINKILKLEEGKAS